MDGWDGWGTVAAQYDIMAASYLDIMKYSNYYIQVIIH